MTLDEGDTMVDVARLVSEDNNGNNNGNANSGEEGVAEADLAPAGGAPTLEEEIGG